MTQTEFDSAMCPPLAGSEILIITLLPLLAMAMAQLSSSCLTIREFMVENYSIGCSGSGPITVHWTMSCDV